MATSIEGITYNGDFKHPSFSNFSFPKYSEQDYAWSYSGNDFFENIDPERYKIDSSSIIIENTIPFSDVVERVGGFDTNHDSKVDRIIYEKHSPNNFTSYEIYLDKDANGIYDESFKFDGQKHFKTYDRFGSVSSMIEPVSKGYQKSDSTINIDGQLIDLTSGLELTQLVPSLLTYTNLDSGFKYLSFDNNSCYDCHK